MSPSRPHHEVYQDNMILCLHGFPQFCADPMGNGSLNLVNGIPRVEIGDLGYFREGRFFRIKSLDIDAICGRRDHCSKRYVHLAKPECGGSVRKIDLDVGANAEAGLVMPLGCEFNAKISCERGEGALLNLETGRALFEHCMESTKVRLGNYMKANYRSWLNEKENANVFTAHDLFLVTGTYMTKNWEAATFVSNQHSFGGSISVDAMNLANGHFKIDWSTCGSQNRGFNTGHIHIGQNLPDHNTVPSFGACCHCEQTPENQCIFLRGWRIREMFRFAGSCLALPISVENVKSAEWRQAQIVKKRSFSASKPIRKYLRAQGIDRPQDAEAIIGEEMKTVLDREKHGDIYDFVAIYLHQQEQKDLIMIHDDDVIAFLEGSSVDYLVEERRRLPNEEFASSKGSRQSFTTSSSSTATNTSKTLLYNAILHLIKRDSVTVLKQVSQVHKRKGGASHNESNDIRSVPAKKRKKLDGEEFASSRGSHQLSSIPSSSTRRQEEVRVASNLPTSPCEQMHHATKDAHSTSFHREYVQQVVHNYHHYNGPVVIYDGPNDSSSFNASHNVIADNQGDTFSHLQTNQQMRHSTPIQSGEREGVIPQPHQVHSSAKSSSTTTTAFYDQRSLRRSASKISQLSSRSTSSSKATWKQESTEHQNKVQGTDNLPPSAYKQMNLAVKGTLAASFHRKSKDSLSSSKSPPSHRQSSESLSRSRNSSVGPKGVSHLTQSTVNTSARILATTHPLQLNPAPGTGPGNWVSAAPDQQDGGLSVMPSVSATTLQLHSMNVRPHVRSTGARATHNVPPEKRNQIRRPNAVTPGNPPQSAANEPAAEEQAGLMGNVRDWFSKLFISTKAHR